jgi:hypothetical protein
MGSTVSNQATAANSSCPKQETLPQFAAPLGWPLQHSAFTFTNCFFLGPKQKLQKVKKDKMSTYLSGCKRVDLKIRNLKCLSLKIRNYTTAIPPTLWSIQIEKHSRNGN